MVNPPTLSVILCVKNEERLLPQVLSSIETIADEVIVIDTGSTDTTVDLAKAAGARVLHFKGQNYIESWNEALGAATCDWVLNLDGDEVVSGIDLPELRRLIRLPSAHAFKLRARNYSRLMDLAYKWHPNDGRYEELETLSGCPGFWVSYPLRLFRRHPEVRFRIGATNHTRPDDSIAALGWDIQTSDVTLHNLGVIKGGDRYLAAKNVDRLQGELNFEEREPGDNVNIARTLIFLGDDRAALTHLEAALTSDPDFVDAHYFRGLVLKETENYPEASEALLQCLARDRDHADAWTVLGMVYQLWGRPGESEGALLRALALRPNHPLAHNSIAITYEDQGRFQEAEASYLRALDFHPTLPCALENLLALLEAQQRTSEADRYRAQLRTLADTGTP